MSLPTYDAVPPSIRPVIPSVLPPSPSSNDANGDKWPRDIAPATKSQPNTPVSSGNQCFISLPCRMGIILYIHTSTVTDACHRELNDILY